MPFTSITWSPNELVTHEKLNQMANNDEYLNDRLPLFDIVGPEGAPSSSKVSIEAVTKDIFTGDWSYETGDRIIVNNISFQSPFLYQPIVVAQYVTADVNYREVSVAVQGLQGSKQPTKNGIKVHVVHNKGSAPWPNPAVTGQYFIHYMAIGIKP